MKAACDLGTHIQILITWKSCHDHLEVSACQSSKPACRVLWPTHHDMLEDEVIVVCLMIAVGRVMHKCVDLDLMLDQEPDHVKSAAAREDSLFTIEDLVRYYVVASMLT